METQSDNPNFERLMELLQTPSAYSHEVRFVQLVQTHCSCVFLTGDYAYKVKKPVDFGFLDYRTLEQRRFWCEQELRLNRRLCPDLYLEVVPVTLEDGHVTVGGSGTPIEWAVRMRQLQAEEMLPQRLQNDTVGHQKISRLALRLAEFHRDAPCDDAIRAFGTLAAITQTIAVTLRTMDTVADDSRSAESRASLRRYLEGFLDTHRILFAQRNKEDRIRDCHGDLRTQNICLDARYDNGIQIFDCIEFNDAFRYIDVAADIAYLAMDLDLTGHADLRADLLHTYARETQDRSLAQILPFYMVYRAVVRGNIALLASRESEIPEPERLTHYEIAATAYDLAQSYIRRRPRPALFITVGYSGIGKSVLAKELVRRLPAVYLSSDRLRKARAGHVSNTPLASAHYTAASRSEVYRTLRERAGEYLTRGQHVLLDATFLSPDERKATARLAQNHHAEFWVIECQAPDAVIRQRLLCRHADPNASDADLTVYEQQRFDYAEAGPLPPPGSRCREHLVADTTQAVAESAHHIVEQFRAQSAI